MLFQLKSRNVANANSFSFEQANEQFAHWRDLFKTNKEEFERQRKQAIEDVIQSAPEHLRDRLKALQWKIDTTLNKIKNPTMRNLKMQDLFWEQTLKFNATLKALTGKIPSKQSSTTSAEIIPFKTK